MATLYLKFADEAQANSILRDSDGNAKYANVSAVSTGGADAPPGYHVNVEVLPGEDETALLPFSIVTPADESE